MKYQLGDIVTLSPLVKGSTMSVYGSAPIHGIKYIITRNGYDPDWYSMIAVDLESLKALGYSSNRLQNRFIGKHFDLVEEKKRTTHLPKWL